MAGKLIEQVVDLIKENKRLRLLYESAIEVSVEKQFKIKGLKKQINNLQLAHNPNVNKIVELKLAIMNIKLPEKKKEGGINHSNDLIKMGYNQAIDEFQAVIDKLKEKVCLINLRK